MDLHDTLMNPTPMNTSPSTEASSSPAVPAVRPAVALHGAA
jgi:hypothetical protein